MVVRGRIEELLPPNRARVRIPQYDGEAGLTGSTETQFLNIATVATLAGIYPNLKIGDEVFVSFENRKLESPVILGSVMTDDTSSPDNHTTPDAFFQNLKVGSEAVLPPNTSIGNVSPKEIGYIKGLSDNVQFQFN